MNNTMIIIISLSLVGLGMSLMIWRDYRNMKRATVKQKDLSEFLHDLDSHDPTPYDKLVMDEKKTWAEAAVRRYNVPVGVDKDKAHLFDGKVKILDEKEKENG